MVSASYIISLRDLRTAVELLSSINDTFPVLKADYSLTTSAPNWTEFALSLLPLKPLQ